MIQQILLILVGGIFVNNFITSKFLGICPFLGVSKKVDTAIGMGMAVIFVITLASLITYLIQVLILVPLNIVFMQTIAFILVIAALVQFVEMVIKKISPTLYQALGVYLPLITTNCAVLGVAIINVTTVGIKDSVILAVFNGFAAAVGFTMAMVLFAGIRERLELAEIPECFRGFPIAMISAGLMAIAFLGFSGLVK